METPIHGEALAVHASIPCPTLPAEGRKVGKPAATQALPGEEAEFGFGRIEPTAVLGSILHRESAPHLCPLRCRRRQSEICGGEC